MGAWYVMIDGKKVSVMPWVAQKYGCYPGMKMPFTGYVIMEEKTKK